MADAQDPQIPSDRNVGEDIAAANARLADWAARSAAESDLLIERFERMGYEVRGKSEEEIADILRRRPTRQPR